MLLVMITGFGGAIVIRGSARSVDLFSVRPVIGPSDRQVGLGQVRVVCSDLRIGQLQPAPRNETRDRVPRISNAWLATTHA